MDNPEKKWLWIRRRALHWSICRRRSIVNADNSKRDVSQAVNTRLDGYAVTVTLS
jgi:hypothetical protein